jgi:hypothetical protein
MFSKGLISRPGSQPLPANIVDILGHCRCIPEIFTPSLKLMTRPPDGWSLMGGNQIVTGYRLKRLGWEPVETKEKSLMAYLPEELELAISQSTTLNFAKGILKE